MASSRKSASSKSYQEGPRKKLPRQRDNVEVQPTVENDTSSQKRRASSKGNIAGKSKAATDGGKTPKVDSSKGKMTKKKMASEERERLDKKPFNKEHTPPDISAPSSSAAAASILGVEKTGASSSTNNSGMAGKLSESSVAGSSSAVGAKSTPGNTAHAGGSTIKKSSAAATKTTSAVMKKSSKTSQSESRKDSSRERKIGVTSGPIHSTKSEPKTSSKNKNAKVVQSDAITTTSNLSSAPARIASDAKVLVVKKGSSTEPKNQRLKPLPLLLSDSSNNSKTTSSTEHSFYGTESSSNGRLKRSLIQEQVFDECEEDSIFMADVNISPSLSSSTMDVTKIEQSGDFVQKSSSLKSEPTLSSKIELDLSPKSEPVFSSKSEPVFSPKSEPVFSPRSESILSPKSESILSPKSESILSPKSESILSPKSESILSPKSEPVFSSKSEPVFSPKSEPVFSPKSESIFSPKSESIFSPKSESIFSPISESILSPKSESILSPKSESILSPKSESILSPKSESILSPKSESILSPKSESILSPKSESILSPKSESILSPKSEPILSIKPESPVSPIQLSPSELQKQKREYHLRDLQLADPCLSVKVNLQKKFNLDTSSGNSYLSKDFVASNNNLSHPPFIRHSSSPAKVESYFQYRRSKDHLALVEALRKFGLSHCIRFFSHEMTLAKFMTLTSDEFLETYQVTNPLTRKQLQHVITQLKAEEDTDTETIDVFKHILNLLRQ